MNNWIPRARKFIAEVRSEMSKVSFPSRAEVVTTTGVVLVTMLAFAVFLYAADVVVLQGYQALLELVGGS